MVDEILNGQKITGKEKILDAGCGGRSFTFIVAEKFAKLSGKSIDKVIEEKYLFYRYIKRIYKKKTKQNLQKLLDKRFQNLMQSQMTFVFIVLMKNLILLLEIHLMFAYKI